MGELSEASKARGSWCLDKGTGIMFK